MAGALSGLLDQPFLAVGVVQTAALVGATLLLLYPVVAYARNVAYTEGVVALAVGLALVSVSNVVTLLPEATVRSAVPVVSPHPLVVSSLLNLLAGTAGTVGVYFFAREFLPGGERDRPVEEDSREPQPTGGFESADDREGEDAD
jgi:hypothetical protein